MPTRYAVETKSTGAPAGPSIVNKITEGHTEVSVELDHVFHLPTPG